MTYRLSLSAVTGSEPITTAEAKAHLRVDLSDDDVQIAGLASAAREAFEDETGRQLVRATYVLTLDAFPDSRHTPIELPRPPLSSVTSIKYLNTGGTETTWDAAEYTVQAYGGPLALPGRVFPGATFDWPTTQDVPGAVSITYVCGFADGAVPEAIRSSLLLILGDLYGLREGQVVGAMVAENKTLQRLLNRYRIPVLA